MSIILDARFDGLHMQADFLAIATKVAFFTTDDPLSFILEGIKLHGNTELDASLSGNNTALGDNVCLMKRSSQHSQTRILESIITEATTRTVESTLYLSVMGDPLSGIAPKKFVNIFFREERLPVAEGNFKSPTELRICHRECLLRQSPQLVNRVFFKRSNSGTDRKVYKALGRHEA
ncbi:hypothetical protein D9758_010762 [Tetrapyrgos nigripes]|uniref:Uncharacterized protein n=1 Tax=Tetrapyrgos nigripes TaxID=182062 RepID=A0A8H5D759_9AGAR|nr:hypothetical protein D9758_010762 [Tetrapyrgos nigripes]